MLIQFQNDKKNSGFRTAHQDFLSAALVSLVSRQHTKKDLILNLPFLKKV